MKNRCLPKYLPILYLFYLCLNTPYSSFLSTFPFGSLILSPFFVLYQRLTQLPNILQRSCITLQCFCSMSNRMQHPCPIIVSGKCASCNTLQCLCPRTNRVQQPCPKLCQDGVCVSCSTMQFLCPRTNIMQHLCHVTVSDQCESYSTLQCLCPRIYKMQDHCPNIVLSECAICSTMQYLCVRTNKMQYHCPTLCQMSVYPAEHCTVSVP